VAKTEDLVSSYMDWVTLSSTDEEFADDIARTLKPNLKFYPEQSRIDAQCVTLLKAGTSEVSCGQCCSPHCPLSRMLTVASVGEFALQEPVLLYTEAKALEDGKEAIKGPVSQYNFFSMESRRLIRDSSRDCEVLTRSPYSTSPLIHFAVISLKMSNNEWNRLVGKRWRELTAREHEPFKQMALLDKKRYEAVRVGCTMHCRPAAAIAANDIKQCMLLLLFRSALLRGLRWRSASSKGLRLKTIPLLLLY
jgi:hypothetical protein